MLNIKLIEDKIIELVKSAGATIYKVGASNLSDSIYINIRVPKLISKEYGVFEDWEILVRVSNHFNCTNTEDKLNAHMFINIYEDDKDINDELIDSMLVFISTLKQTYVE